MPIVSSQIVEDRPQRDGRRAVRERHVDHVGAVHYVTYLAESIEDASAMMTSRVSQINQILVAGEIGANTAEVDTGEV